MMNIQTYLNNINLRFKTGISREHTYRGDLQNLLMAILPDILVTNEPSRISCGAPDYVLTCKDIPVGYIEAKDIGVDLKSKSLKEQFDRYREGLNNLIFTDYLNFHFYKDGVFTTSVAIATITEGSIVPLPQNFDSFTTLITNFAQTVTQSIKSPTKLAQMMAGKAKLMANVIEQSLNKDDENDTRSSLKRQMLSFKQMLIHDINNQAFADIYAQTIAYGMFAARYHDPTLPTFSRQEAATLIPKSNPFLRKLFQDIAGYDLDDRLVWIVDELVNIFLATDVADIMKNFGKSTKQEDPVVHFYETFLAAYNPALRKARGVWYTPQPVVNFIVRAVDDILKTEFNLPQGLADNSKITVPFPSNSGIPEGRGGKFPYIGGVPEGRGGKEVHRVQILDPATGTGTFLAEVVKHIYQKFKGQQGIWSNYVNQHLIPRLNGFELLMASYAMAHLKMDMLLTETGYKATTDQRFRIFLTNSLEEAHPDSGTLFSSWLSDEAEQANAVKRDTPVMVIMGNPPYNANSKNQEKWIMDLMNDYKLEPGSKEKLKERNPKMINDDYVKFIRQAQYFIEKNDEGILAFINPHGLLDSDTFRGVRWELYNVFNKIYIVDLEGNAKKEIKDSDGNSDQNIFDILQGVSINLFIKCKGIKKSTSVFYKDLIGKREYKYDYLNRNNLFDIDFQLMKPKEPNFYFKPKGSTENMSFLDFLSLKDLYNFYSTGMQTDNDNFCIKHTELEIAKVYTSITNLSNNELLNKYSLKNTSSWNVEDAKIDILKSNLLIADVSKVCYRPFDTRFTYYTGNSNGFMGRPRLELIKSIDRKNNLSLITIKNSRSSGDWSQVWLTNLIPTKPTTITALDANYSFPLYLYPETNTQLSIGGSQKTTPPVGHPSAGGECRTPNLNAEIVQKIAQKLNLTFVPEKNSSINSPTSDERQQDTLYFPPLEGCPQGGVVNIPPTQTGVVNNTHPQTIEAKQPTTIVTTINNTPIIRNFVENLPHNPKLNQLAKDKRKAGILSEVLFWQQVHKGKFHNLDFDRQRIIGNYIVDFYVKTLGLIIEIDGNSHDNKQEYDAARQIYLENHGLKLYRILDWDVKQSLTGVMIALEDYIIKEFGEKIVLNSESGKVVKETTPPVGHPSKGGEFATPVCDHPSKGGELNGELAPIDLLDYIYAVLHSPAYREKYKEFLKIDFPRVPYPTDATTFWQLVKLGGEIRQIHLLESPETENYITQYPIDGDNVVVKPRFVNSPPLLERQLATLNSPPVEERKLVTLNSPPLEGCPQGGVVYINDTQYFANVPLTAWEFYIGGYQPAQKWLKDRKGRSLQFEDILHYQKIIVALKRTAELMVEIDGVLEV